MNDPSASPQPAPASCLLGLGANQGDRAATLVAAIDAFAETPGVTVQAVSPWQSSRAVGGPDDQHDFLNGAALLATSLAPAELLARLREIESAHGRERRVRWAARTLDIDILLYSDQLIDDQSLGLRIPHPRMSFRPFVIEPAAQIAPDVRHPQLGATLAELAQRLAQGEDCVALVGGDEMIRGSVAHELRSLKRDFEVAVDSIGYPKLQICLDEQTKPLPGTPTLWLTSTDSGERRAELLAAVECVWPSLG